METFSRPRASSVLEHRSVVCVVVVLLSVATLVSPAAAIDWSKRQQATPPPDAPQGWTHWWAAQEYLKENNCGGAIRESSYLLSHPQYSTPAYSQKALILHGRCYEELGDPAKAMKSYLTALKKYGNNEEAFFLLGILYLREENPTQAIKALRGALSMNPKNGDAERSLAESYVALGQVGEAQASIERAKSLGADVDHLLRKLRRYREEHGISSGER